MVGVVVAVAFEAIAVATAMPVAARELDGLRFYGLAFSVFLTASLLGMVVAGDVCDRRGPVRPFVAAAVTFALGLLLAGLATEMWVLVVARAVQGFGGGLNIVAIYVVVGRAFPAALRPRVFSATSSGWILPSLVGPPVAGLLADHASWRWVFLGVLPLLAGAALLVGPHLRGLDGPAVNGDDASEPHTMPRRSRVPAAVVAAVGAGLLQYGGQALTGQLALAVPLIVIGVGLLAYGVPRLLPPGAFRLGRGLPTVVVMRGVMAGAFFGTEVLHPPDAGGAAVGRDDAGRALSDRSRADLVARRLAPGPPRPADAAMGPADRRLPARARRHRAGCPRPSPAPSRSS